MPFTIFYNEKSPFYAIKSRSSKIRKIDISPKGVNPWFWSKHCHFLSTFFFRQYRQGKCLIRYSRTKKTFFFAIKARSSKSRKIDIFPKGLNHGFGPKMTFFRNFFFRQYNQAKCLLRYFATKKLLSRL